MSTTVVVPLPVSVHQSQPRESKRMIPSERLGHPPNKIRRVWHSRLKSACVLFGTLLLSLVARGQNARPAQPKNEFGAWGAYSLGSPHVIAISGDNQLGVIAFRYGRILVDKHRFSFEWTIDVAPVEIVRQPRVIAVSQTPAGISFVTSGHQVVYGGGVSPIGLKFNFFRHHTLQLFGASTGGFVASVVPVPVNVPGEEQFNFAFDLQAGFQRFNSSRTRAWMVGYKFQHISNAYRGAVNPGADFNVFFAGYSFYK
jgi:hypothetical protein